VFAQDLGCGRLAFEFRSTTLQCHPLGFELKRIGRPWARDTTAEHRGEGSGAKG
jgi:hypothetical protein